MGVTRMAGVAAAFGRDLDFDLELADWVRAKCVVSELPGDPGERKERGQKDRDLSPTQKFFLRSIPA